MQDPEQAKTGEILGEASSLQHSGSGMGSKDCLDRSTSTGTDDRGQGRVQEVRGRRAKRGD